MVPLMWPYNGSSGKGAQMSNMIFGRSAEDRKKGMTFRELRLFVQEGMKVDLPDDAILKGALGWKQQIATIRVEPPNGT